ncbi:MAG: glycosyltransferase family 39 protein [Candidatus Omnitrophota bacterium]|nr:glycosyltransferase family 39 protein [Candidatus Omnitrophota bacterium]
MERTKTIRDLLLIFIASSLILLWNLGTGSLTSWDEAVYAQVSREILTSNNWIDLTWAGEHWADKPPLYMWMTVLFYKIFGVNEFSARFFSALCGIGTVIITYLFAKKLYSRRVAFVSALVLLSTRHFIWAAKMGMLDIALTFFLTLSLFLFRLGEEKKIYLFFSLISFAFAFLTKGTGALLIPLILLFYLFSAGKTKILKEPAFMLGVLASLFILAWWHWLAIRHYGKEFVSGYFIRHLFVRTTQAIEGHAGSIFNYFKVLPNKGRPWGIFGFLVLPVVVWRVIKKKEKEHILPIVWSICVFSVASLIRTKLHWYIISLYPSFSILIGWAISKIFRKFTVIVTTMLVFSSLIYLSFGKKSVFNLDHCPETKKVASAVKQMLPKGEKVFLYEVGDPGIRFYFAEIGKSISGTLKLQELLKEKDRYIVFESNAFKVLAESDFLVVVRTPDLVIAKIK